jgi:gas vesicle protein
MQDLQAYGESDARSFGFAYGVLVGTALGAAVALLFAPKAGSELRGQLADATSRIRQRAGQAYNRASSGMDDMKRGMEDMTSRTRSSAP